MLNHVNRFLSARLSRSSFNAEDDMYAFLTTLGAAYFCLIAHIFLLAVFITAGAGLLVGINAASVLAYCMLPILVRKHKYVFVGCFLTIEVTAYTLAAAYLLGIGYYILGYFLLALVLQIAVPYGGPKLRACMTGLVLAAAVACLGFPAFFEQKIALSPGIERFMLCANVFLLFVGVLGLLLLCNLSGKIIDSLRDARLADVTKQANTDPLTGLFNRRYADQFFKAHVPESGLASVAMVDIDDFKVVNDTYGHAVGDEVLRFLADFLRSNLRISDVLFRWGGEEFLIILQGTRVEAAFVVLDGLRQKLENSDITVSGVDHPLRIQVTIGLSGIDHAHPFDSIDQSDKKLYAGKKGSKNVVVV